MANFKASRELLKVAKLGPKAFEQCAGFLRITDGGRIPLTVQVCIRSLMMQRGTVIR